MSVSIEHMYCISMTCQSVCSHVQLCQICLFVCLQQAQAEQEEEFISNTLLKKIHCLKKEKEALAMNYEQEEEFLTNDLSRKLAQVSHKMRNGMAIAQEALLGMKH